MMLCWVPRLFEPFHGNEEMSVEVDRACVHVYGCGGTEVVRGKCCQTEFLHLKSFGNHLCTPSSTPKLFACYWNWSTHGQSAVKNWFDKSNFKSLMVWSWQYLFWSDVVWPRWGCFLLFMHLSDKEWSPPVCLLPWVHLCVTWQRFIYLSLQAAVLPVECTTNSKY